MRIALWAIENERARDRRRDASDGLQQLTRQTRQPEPPRELDGLWAICRAAHPGARRGRVGHRAIEVVLELVRESRHEQVAFPVRVPVNTA
jgi:hypothetical protein